jgi:cytochrome c
VADRKRRIGAQRVIGLATHPTGPCARAALRCIAPFIIALSASAAPAGDAARGPYGLGHVPPPDLIEQWDIAIGPAGAELPAGSGTVAAGKRIYAERCALCHGAAGRDGPDPALAGGNGTLSGPAPELTIGSYWPHATTVYDYIYRAMPFTAPGSLRPDEVYALCAYLLNANGIIAADAVMDRNSLPAVRMPNRGGFIPDPRPETN